MNMKTAIILATARQNGNTHNFVQEVMKVVPADLINLAEYNILPLNYNLQNDDFIGIIEKLVKYDHLAFASPVYWYTMSGQMKIFIDRFLEVLHLKRPLGQMLKGKMASVIATGNSKEAPETYWETFKQIFEYLHMENRTTIYLDCSDKFNAALAAKLASIYFNQISNK